MRIARVQAAAAPEEARRTFDRGLGAVRLVDAPERESLLYQARMLAAAVNPGLVREIPQSERMLRHFSADREGQIMLEHGHIEAAIAYVLEYADLSGIPFGLTGSLMRRAPDDTARRALFRRAIEAWRSGKADRFGLYGFFRLVQMHWTVLEAEEARAVVHEIVRVELEQPDEPVDAGYQGEPPVHFTSGREHDLFQVLHILRHLDPPLAEQLIASHRTACCGRAAVPKRLGDDPERSRRADARDGGDQTGPGLRHGRISR
jgi:hypothetical protein